MCLACALPLAEPRHSAAIASHAPRPARRGLVGRASWHACAPIGPPNAPHAPPPSHSPGHSTELPRSARHRRWPKLAGAPHCPPEGPIRRTREGGSEWEPIKILLEGDGNSNKMNAASNTLLQLTTQVGQAHVATGVPLNLGTNTQPSDPRTQRNTKPRVYRPTPVRPVSTTGQTGPCW
jgi:hypothetical protein